MYVSKYVENHWSTFNFEEVSFEGSFIRRCRINIPDVVGKTIPHLPRSNQERKCSPKCIRCHVFYVVDVDR